MQAIRLRQTWERVWTALARNPLAIALPLGLGLGLAVFFCCLERGYFGDEGSACTIAQGILQGRFPYQSYFNEKPPLQYFWTASVMAVSQPSFWAARLAAAVMLILTSVCILSGYAARSRNFPALLGWCLLIFLAALDLSAYEDVAESGLAFLFGASALLVVEENLRGRRLQLKAVLQGAIFGTAVGFRQHAIAPALVMLLLPNAQLPKRAYCFGLILGIACWLAPLIALGIGPDMFNAIVAFHFHNDLVESYFSSPNWSERGGYLLWFLCFVWLAGLKTYRANLPWLIFWLATMALPAYGHMDAFRLWPSAAAALVLIARAAPIKGPIARVPAIAFALIALYALYGTYPKITPDNEKVANAIASMTSTTDRVWVGPSNPLAYCQAQRLPASRYYFVAPWTAKPAVRQQIIADITNTAPKLVVLEHQGEFGALRVMPELLDLVAKNYHVSRTMSGVTFYERNSDARQTP
jgi:hypothetical protein